MKGKKVRIEKMIGINFSPTIRDEANQLAGLLRDTARIDEMERQLLEAKALQTDREDPVQFYPLLIENPLLVGSIRGLLDMAIDLRREGDDNA